MRLHITLAFLAILISVPAVAQQTSVATASELQPGTFSGAKPTEYPPWFKDSFLEFADDVAEAAERGKRVMLIFHQDGCPYCNLLVERNLSQKHIVDLAREKFDVIEINIWGDREVVTVDGVSFTEKEFASALKVQFTPTLLFFNEQGKAVLKLNGYLPPNDFLIALDFVANQKETEMTYRDFVRTQVVKTESQNSLLSEDFFLEEPYNLDRNQTNSNRPLAVFFEQKQCPNCETLHKQVLVDEGVREQIRKFEVVQLDMWSNDMLTTTDGRKISARDWADSLDVSFAPTIILFDRNGNEIIRSEAWFKKFHTESLFDYVSSGANKTESNFQRYISSRADRLIEQGIDVDIWN